MGGRLQGWGAIVGAPLPVKSRKKFSAIGGGVFLLLFLYVGDFLLRFSLYGRPFSLFGGFSLLFFLHMGVFATFYVEAILPFFSPCEGLLCLYGGCLFRFAHPYENFRGRPWAYTKCIKVKWHFKNIFFCVWNIIA